MLLREKVFSTCQERLSEVLKQSKLKEKHRDEASDEELLEELEPETDGVEGAGRAPTPNYQPKK